MAYTSVYIHFVWSTKNRIPFLNTVEIRQKVWFQIKEYAAEKGIFVDHINGYSDHCHCLIDLTGNQSMQDVMKVLKGESSFWINKNRITAEPFSWQDSFWAMSVSPSNIEAVRNYIKNQEERHGKESFEKELEAFDKYYGFITVR